MQLWIRQLNGNSPAARLAQSAALFGLKATPSGRSASSWESWFDFCALPIRLKGRGSNRWSLWKKSLQLKVMTDVRVAHTPCGPKTNFTFFSCYNFFWKWAHLKRFAYATQSKMKNEYFFLSLRLIEKKKNHQLQLFTNISTDSNSHPSQLKTSV